MDVLEYFVAIVLLLCFIFNKFVAQRMFLVMVSWEFKMSPVQCYHYNFTYFPVWDQKSTFLKSELICHVIPMFHLENQAQILAVSRTQNVLKHAQWWYTCVYLWIRPPTEKEKQALNQLDSYLSACRGFFETESSPPVFQTPSLSHPHNQPETDGISAINF